ncbi:MAG: restriction endonuclease [Porticoccaceae bacterium]
MGRRRRSGLADDIIGIAAALPWWAGILLAVLAYGFLRHHAMVEVQVSGVPGTAGSMVAAQLTKTLAFYGQFLVPPLLLVGALVSFLRRRKRSGLIGNVTGDENGNALLRLSWQDFELLVGEVFRKRGFSVSETGGGGADGGIDLELRKDGEVFLVQCKQWRAFRVSGEIVRELFGVMAARGATGGFVVTSGIFTSAAQSFAKGRNIELIDGKALRAMIRTVNKANTPGEAAIVAASEVIAPMQSESRTAEPSCPRCGGGMVKRVARQGANVGGAFWGCASYPKCRGVQPG